MVDVIGINPSPTGSFLYMINPSGYALRFIIYYVKHERVYVSYILNWQYFMLAVSGVYVLRWLCSILYNAELSIYLKWHIS